jgi:hypothetical protein
METDALAGRSAAPFLLRLLFLGNTNLKERRKSKAGECVALRMRQPGGAKPAGD